VETLCDQLAGEIGHQTFIASILGMRRTDVYRCIRPGSQLLGMGLLNAWEGYRSTGLDSCAELPDRITVALQEADGTIEGIKKFLLGEPCISELEWEDFSHLADSIERIAAFLKQSLQKGTEGVNILLYGPPGTGKTEFCKTLATRLGTALYAVGEKDSNGQEPERNDRLNAFNLAQGLFRHQGNTLLMFDEMEDLFTRHTSIFRRGKVAGDSKVYTNRLLEKNPVPTIWVINNPNLITDAHIRRMSLALEIKTPPASARRQVLCRILKRHGCTLPDEDITDLTRQDGIAPAILDSAVRFAASTGGDADEVRFAARSIVKAMAGGAERPEAKKVIDDFNPMLMNTDSDLIFLADRLDTGKTRAFSLCLYGPPGTGKTEYVRYLASRMGMEVLVKRASDIFGMFVGQTEAAIAGAFREAKEEEKFLVFDEADSFLADRKGAYRSWEVTQVNEMLTWMESHPLPFACTTNLMDHLDEASLRRFTFKVKFDFMNHVQLEQAFRHFFKLHPPAGLKQLTSMTPGDLAVVRKRAEVMDINDKPEEILNFLHAEMNIKKTEIKVGGFSRH
jgi:SpoVK/Ycf46/Vps4 family AAA+-type ATPase